MIICEILALSGERSKLEYVMYNGRKWGVDTPYNIMDLLPSDSAIASSLHAGPLALCMIILIDRDKDL